MKSLGTLFCAAKAAHKVDSLRWICDRHEGGIYKRIDENRELYLLLKERCPNFLQECFWVEGWTKSQDHFLWDIERVIRGELANPLFGPDIVSPVHWDENRREV